MIMETYEELSNGFLIPIFLVELLLQEVHFGYNTHTEMNTGTYI